MEDLIVDKIHKLYTDSALISLSDYESSQLQHQARKLMLKIFSEEKKARQEAEEDRDVYLRCLNGSTKAKYTAELYDKQVARADALQEENVRWQNAFNSAKAFIDSHVADPDITEEMVRAYAEYQRQLKALSTTPESSEFGTNCDKWHGE